MSQEDVEVVHRFLEAYNRRDREAVAALFHPHIEWHTMAGAISGVDAYWGREDSLRFMFEEIPDAIDGFRVVVEDVGALADGGVLVVARYVGRGVTSGATVEMSAAAIYRVDGGVIRSFREYTTRDEALEAAGLRE
jgi:ketosteroid isomerase-like protein